MKFWEITESPNNPFVLSALSRILVISVGICYP